MKLGVPALGPKFDIAWILAMLHLVKVLLAMSVGMVKCFRPGCCIAGGFVDVVFASIVVLSTLGVACWWHHHPEDRTFGVSVTLAGSDVGCKPVMGPNGLTSITPIPTDWEQSTATPGERDTKSSVSEAVEERLFPDFCILNVYEEFALESLSSGSSLACGDADASC